MYNDESVLENHHLAVAFKLTHPGATPGRGRSLLSTVALLLWCRVGAGVDVQRRVGAGEPSPGSGVQAAAGGRLRRLQTARDQDATAATTHHHRPRQ